MSLPDIREALKSEVVRGEFIRLVLPSLFTALKTHLENADLTPKNPVSSTLSENALSESQVRDVIKTEVVNLVLPVLLEKQAQHLGRTRWQRLRWLFSF